MLAVLFLLEKLLLELYFAGPAKSQPQITPIFLKGESHSSETISISLKTEMLLLLTCSFDYNDNYSASITVLAFPAKLPYSVAETHDMY